MTHATQATNEQRALAELMARVQARNPHEPEFLQAVHEVMESVVPFALAQPRYQEAGILDRMTEPDRIVSFRVVWENDRGMPEVNRAWRVQFNGAIGPYKGGMRFHPTVNASVLKFLGFEQTFKNALTGLPMGGGKGGADFDPKGKSDREVMRFCHALMNELVRHIGADVDVPAGDIGVAAREVGFLFGQQRRLRNEYRGTFTGKGLSYGGSAGRTEATGYGAVYFAEEMLRHHGEALQGKTALVSGSGNVAVYCIEKLLHSGVRVLTASDSSGFVHDPDGFDEEKLAFLRALKEERRERIGAYVARYSSATFHADKRPWGVAGDLAFPCATQNEISDDDAQVMVRNGVSLVAEGANMPTEAKAVERLLDAGVLFGPGKAANAGGVSVSGLEQSQNALRLSWTREEVDQKLRAIMANIHASCVEHGRDPSGKQQGQARGEGHGKSTVNYVRGANVAAFVKVADAMLAYGWM